MFRGVVGLTVAMALFVGLGCGGSDPEPLTKTEFGQQGNKICKEATKTRGEAIAKVIEETDPKTDQVKAQEKAIQSGLPSYEKAAEQIDDLGAPEGEEEMVESLVGAMEEAAERVKADPHTATVSNVPFKEADKLATEMGLTECVV